MSGSEVTLLLVEDDDVDAINLERGLRKKKIANPIMRVHDGIEALEVLREGGVNSPFLILLDLQMPRMNGLEFLEEIRSDPQLHRAVVFVLTTSRDSRDIFAGYEKHIAGYFIKDETHENFMEVIDMLEGYWKIAHLPELE